MKVDVLVAEIGSTTTVVNAFDGIHGKTPRFVGGAQAPTSVLEGDVRIGLQGAVQHLKQHLGADELVYDEMFATSSAAGGLKMSVHGLVFDMTVCAAKEAALGAGAIVHQVTAGKLRQTDLVRLKENVPNMVLIAGGVDYGERETALYNAKKIAELRLEKPVIYAGNVENQEAIQMLFEDFNQPELYVVDNVFPKVDELNVIPTRRVIQVAFEKNIIHAPGMEHVFELIDTTVMPTPAAVMRAAELVHKHLGDCLVLDVGGATTDVHSVTEGDEAISRIQVSPEPCAKRTVEGDLGVYVNVNHVIELVGANKLRQEGFDLDHLMANYHQIPKNEAARKLTCRLTEEAAVQAIRRHVGRIRHVYGPTGRQNLAEGKDLTQVEYLIGTGGALTRLDAGKAMLEKLVRMDHPHPLLLPNQDVKVMLDHDYVMASVGVLATRYEAAALNLLMQSLH